MTVETICKRTKHLRMVEMPLKARVILRGMTNNPHFPDAGPLLAQLESAREDMEMANLACLDGGRIATADRRKYRTALEHVLDALVGHVKAYSKRNVTIALSSGFQLRKTPLQLPLSGMPENLCFIPTDAAGVLELRWDPEHGARTYLVQMNVNGPADPNGWILIATPSRAKLRITGLESGRYYWFRIATSRAAGMSPMSQVARCMPY